MEIIWIRGIYRVAEKLGYAPKGCEGYGANANVACRFHVALGNPVVADIQGIDRNDRNWPCKDHLDNVDQDVDNPGTLVAQTCN